MTEGKTFNFRINRSLLAQTPPYNEVSPELYDILMSGTHDEEKASARKKMLAEHPEARITVNTKELKKIVDFIDFKCHPKCSIARNEAIKGSDIDAGIVVTSEPVSVEQQLAFVTELRNQGFAVNTQAEYEETQRAFAATTYKQQQESPVRFMEYETKRIRFFTKKELEEMCENPVGNIPAMIYLVGKSIG